MKDENMLKMKKKKKSMRIENDSKSFIEDMHFVVDMAIDIKFLSNIDNNIQLMMSKNIKLNDVTS